MTPPADRVAAFAADVEAGPEALDRLLDAWRPVDLAGRARLAFTGLGSSRYAALIAATALRAAGVSAWAEHATASTPTAPADDLAVFAISASGRTPEVVAAAERHRGRSRVIAMTNDPSSALAAAADDVVALGAGVETSGIACRTFRATLAALALATGLATPDDLRPAVPALAARLASADDWAPPVVAALDGAPSIDVLADGSLLGLAEQAALMLREAPRLPAHAWESGDWLHVGVYLALPRHRALLYPGSPADAEVAATIERRGGAVAHVEPGPAAPIERALVDSVVAEVVAARLWDLASAT